MSMNRTPYERRAQVLKALAHPSRLMLVDVLASGERCVGDLTRLLGAEPSTISKHLAVLRAVGLVEDRKQGLQVFYRLRVPCIMQFFGCIEAVLRANEAAWRDAVVVGPSVNPAPTPDER
jgi:ArsR family transcriptional regulator